jgi:flagellar basal body-associated protein FliL
MADEDEIKEKEEQKNPNAEKGDKKSFISRLLPWVIIVVVAAFCAGTGFGLGRLFGGSRTPESAESDLESDESVQANEAKASDDSIEDPDKVWYYDLEPVVANLNEPSVTRYVSASLTLQMSSELEQKEGTELLDKNKPILINWLTVFLSGLCLEDIRGDKNLKSIQVKICEAFNDQLFPDSKPQIKQVLIKGFPVQ